METPQESITCVFATYKDDTLIGYRCDSFGSTSKEWAKPYSYNPGQVAIVLENVKAELNHAGTKFMKTLAGMNTVGIDINSGNELPMDSVVDRVLKQEDELRALEEFEVRVLVSPLGYNELYDIGVGEEWKKQKFLDDLLTAEVLETHKFSVVTNEN